MGFKDKIILLVAGIVLLFATGLGIFVWGYVARDKSLVSEELVAELEEAFGLVKESAEKKTLSNRHWYFKRTSATTPARYHGAGEPDDALTLVTSVRGDNRLTVQIVDRQGATVHEWELDWFDLFPDPTHVPPGREPKRRPGTHLHGAVLLDDGSVVANFEHLATVRLDRCGEVLWKLPRLTHHSIYPADDGTLWIPGETRHLEAPPEDFPLHRTPLTEDAVYQVDPATGQVIREISLFDVLRVNGYQSLLYMTPRKQRDEIAERDLLHLNDVDVFPDSMEPGLFQPGDIMVSLRNIHTVMVFDPDTLKIRFLWIGKDLVSQHDADFMDGNTLSVFDNNNAATSGLQSRILVRDVREADAEVYFAGTDSGDIPFFTPIMGKSEWLPDGGLLIAESFYGRVIELDAAGELLWEYWNLTGDGYTGFLEQASRLTPEQAAMVRDFNCPARQ